MKTSKLLKLCLMSLAMMPLAVFAQSNTKLSIEDFAIKPGETKTMTIDLDNPDMEVTLVQFDMKLPEGLSIVPGEEALEIARTTWRKHSLETNELNGFTRFLLASSSNATLSGTSGAIIMVQLKAADTFAGGTIALQNIEIVAPDVTTVHPADVELTITLVQSSVSIKANDLTMVYGNQVPELTYTITDGEALGTPELSCEATSESPVGTYPIIISEGTLTNDIKNLTNGTLTITKAPLTITAQSYTITQGDELPEFAVTYRGFKNNDTEDNALSMKPIISCAVTDSNEPGEYAIIVSGASATNYVISYVAGTLTIEEKTPEIIIDEEGSYYIVEDDYTVSFAGNDYATGSFEIPSTVTTSGGVTLIVNTIAQGAFRNNTGLTEITIPETITAIGGYALAGCINLTSLICYATTPPVVYDNALPTMRRASSVFAGIDKEMCILYVPEDCTTAYSEAYGWNEFQNILEIGGSGISVLSIDGKPGNVYDMSGRLVRENATTLEGLSKGVYILNGRKVVKK